MGVLIAGIKSIEELEALEERARALLQGAVATIFCLFFHT